MLLLYGFVVSCSLAGILAENQEKGDGALKSLQNFDQSKYMGTWYQHGLVNSETAMKCTKYAWFTRFEEVHTDMFAYCTDENIPFELLAVSRVPDKSKPGQFEITYTPSERMISRWILGTDYTSYSVEYDNFDNGPLVRIVTREPIPPQSVVNKGLKVIREHGFTIEEYVETYQGCWTSEGLLNEEKTTTEASKTEKIAENTTPESQPFIPENDEKTTTKTLETERSQENTTPVSQPSNPENEEKTTKKALETFRGLFKESPKNSRPGLFISNERVRKTLRQKFWNMSEEKVKRYQKVRLPLPGFRKRPTLSKRNEKNDNS